MLNRTIPVSLSRLDDSGYGGSLHDFASTTAGVRTTVFGGPGGASGGPVPAAAGAGAGSGGFTVVTAATGGGGTGAWIVTCGGGM